MSRNKREGRYAGAIKGKHVRMSLYEMDFMYHRPSNYRARYVLNEKIFYRFMDEWERWS